MMKVLLVLLLIEVGTMWPVLIAYAKIRWANRAVRMWRNWALKPDLIVGARSAAIA